MNIRIATAEDVPLIIQLEKTCLTAAHWSEPNYRSAIEGLGSVPQRVVLVAESSSRGTASTGPGIKIPAVPSRKPDQEGHGTIIGFLVARHVSPEWELENIVVAAKERRKGIGEALLAALLDHARQAAAERILLEVRESNAPARKLYEKAAFRETGRRKLYYSNPPEDAILYSQDVV